MKYCNKELQEATEKRLAEIQGRCDAATPGPWEYDRMHPEIHAPESDEYFLICSELREHPTDDAPDRFGHRYNSNFEFLAAARQDVPWLMEELRIADSNLDAVSDMYESAERELSAAKKRIRELEDKLKEDTVMREESLTRGKRLDTGEWIVGILMLMRGQHHIVDPENKNIAFPIDPATVGVYFGESDKNGTKIFENDIVLGEGVVGEEVREPVRFEDGEWAPFDYIGAETVEVVGNIHDNKITGKPGREE